MTPIPSCAALYLARKFSGQRVPASTKIIQSARERRQKRSQRLPLAAIVRILQDGRVIALPGQGGCLIAAMIGAHHDTHLSRMRCLCLENPNGALNAVQCWHDARLFIVRGNENVDKNGRP